MWFYLLVTKDGYWEKFEGNFFPMRNALKRSYRDRLLIGSKVHVGNAVFRKLYVM